MTAAVQGLPAQPKEELEVPKSQKVVPSQPTEEFEVPISQKEAQREAMKQLLKNSRVKSPGTSRRVSPTKKAADKVSVDMSCGLRSTQEEAVKQHLHTLFRTFAR